MVASLNAPRFKPGLALGSDDLYVDRDADDRLFALLSQGTWCHVLAPRQVGKSSLRIRVASRLRETGVRASAVELSAIHVVGDHPLDQQEAWYKALARRIAQPLGLDAAVLKAWQAGASGTPAEQFRLVLRDVIAAPGPLVVFLDEIDRTLSLPASIDRDDFFGLLREIANERADDPIFGRLTICILGVALLSDLSRDPRRTPFTLVEGVELADFSRLQLNRFAPALRALDLPDGAATWLDEIFRWTRGHPAMVQRLCFELARERPGDEAPAAVAALVERTYLRTGLQEDAILVDTNRRFLQRHEELLGGHATHMLELTKQLRRGQRIEFRPQEAAHQALRIAGMAAVIEGRLDLRNEIFRQVFGDSWVRDREGERFLRADVGRWKKWPDHLLRGAALEEALRWEAEQRELNDDERRLIRASLAERERLANEGRAEQERRLRTQRNELIVAIATSIVFLALAALTGFGFWRARGSEREATLQTQEARLAEASALAQLRGREEDAAVTALEASGMVRRLDGRRTAQAKAALNYAIDSLSNGHALSGHALGVATAVFSPDGKRVATASWDKTTRVWDAASGHEIAVLEGHQGEVWGASFSSDGLRLVTTSSDGTARVWDAAGGRELVALRGHGDPAASAAASPEKNYVLTASFSPDGTLVLTAGMDGTARVWDAIGGRELVTLRGHEGRVSGAAFSPDGTRVVTASSDGTARIWAWDGGLITLSADKEPVLIASFSPDGERVLTASWDGTARVWDAIGGRELVALRGHARPLSSAAFSPDGERVLTASSDGTARVWDAIGGRQLVALRGHARPMSGAAFSPDGTRVVTASEDGTVRLWDAAGGRELVALREHSKDVKSVAFSPDGTRVVTASSDRTARVWDAASWRELVALRGHARSVSSAAFSLDGERVVTASSDGTARVWDAANGRELAALRGHEGPVSGAAFSPDGARVLTASMDGAARVWDAAGGRELVVLRGHEGGVWRASFSPDGTRLLTASMDGTARVWDAIGGRELVALRGHKGLVSSASFSPDGAHVLTAGSDKTVRIWDAARGHQVAALNYDKGDEWSQAWSEMRSEVWDASFSPDGTRIVTANEDGTARIWIWDVASRCGRELVVLRGHEGEVWSASFSPDGERVVTASTDDTARVWDAANGRELAALRGHEGAVWRASFSPDGERVLTAGTDGTARVWNLSLRDTIARGCSILQNTSRWGEHPLLREACQAHSTPEGSPLLE